MPDRELVCWSGCRCCVAGQGVGGTDISPAHRVCRLVFKRKNSDEVHVSNEKLSNCNSNLTRLLGSSYYLYQEGEREIDKLLLLCRAGRAAALEQVDSQLSTCSVAALKMFFFCKISILNLMR